MQRSNPTSRQFPPYRKVLSSKKPATRRVCNKHHFTKGCTHTEPPLKELSLEDSIALSVLQRKQKTEGAGCFQGRHGFDLGYFPAEIRKTLDKGEGKEDTSSWYVRDTQEAKALGLSTEHMP